MRWVPPERSARKSSVLSPVMIQSGPDPLDGSRLATSMMFQLAELSQLSVTDALTLTGTIWWLGGQSVSGAIPAAEITGGRLSTTATDVEQESLLENVSETLKLRLLVP